MDNNISDLLNSMILNHRIALTKQKKGEYQCPAHGGCGLPVVSVVYKNDKLGRRTLWGKCGKHGFVALPLRTDLKVPDVGNTKLRSKRYKRQQTLF